MSANGFVVGGTKSWMVIMKVTDDANKAAATYQHQLEGAGYSVKDNVELTGLLSTYTMVGPKYDIRVTGSGERGDRVNPPGLLVTVSSHTKTEAAP